MKKLFATVTYLFNLDHFQDRVCNAGGLILQRVEYYPNANVQKKPSVEHFWNGTTSNISIA